MIPSFPTITFPNFYALATGLYPDHSGMVNNRFFDPAHDSAFEYKKPIAHEAYWWGGEPIWVTATKQGAQAATMFWVGSDAPVGGVRPELWHSYDHAIAFSARVDTMLAWLDLPAGAAPAPRDGLLRGARHAGASPWPRRARDVSGGAPRGQRARAARARARVAEDVRQRRHRDRCRPRDGADLPRARGLSRRRRRLGERQRRDAVAESLDQRARRRQRWAAREAEEAAARDCVEEGRRARAAALRNERAHHA